MPINEEGRALLIADLRANAAHYNQCEFGEVDEIYITEENSCGTVMCLAGFCLLRKLGWNKFTMLAKQHNIQDAAVAAACEQLGFSEKAYYGVPPIFNYVRYWPSDLCHAFICAESNADRVEVAVQALMRLKDDGTIMNAWETNAGTEQDLQVCAV